MIIIYGASDDLIEVEGEIEEEFTYDEEASYLGFSDGTLLSIKYGDEGIWRIAPLVRGAGQLSIVQATSAEDDNYSDRATLEGASISWVLYGAQKAVAKR